MIDLNMSRANFLPEGVGTGLEHPDKNAGNGSDGDDPNRALVAWVTSKLDDWRNNRNQNYDSRWIQYRNLWRGQFTTGQLPNGSFLAGSGENRSKFVSPAISQAIDSAVAEVEEASFGRGKPFVLEGADGATTPEDVGAMEPRLQDDLEKVNARKSTSEAVMNAAIYGTGILEMCVDEYTDKQPEQRPDPSDPSQNQTGVFSLARKRVYWKAIQPNNFLIDPNSATIDDALGCAVEEFVSRHVVERGMDDGTYKREPLVGVSNATTYPNLEKDVDLTIHYTDRVKLTRYFGLVPKRLMFPPDQTVDLGIETQDITKQTDPEEYIESIVVIMDDNLLLKADENPYMMKDRPIVAFPWDLVPNRFWGRGMVEKGYNAQMGLDAELRARFDTLALTVHPMLGIDNTRLPKNFKLKVSPGAIILTNGKPSEVMEPFKIGQLDQNTWQQAAAMEKMVFQATGSLDMTGTPGQIGGDSTAAGMSMSISGAIKRFKRTLMNFHELLLCPAIAKTLWRYMQYDPKRYPANPFSCKPSTLLGMVAREYETSQLVMLLQTAKPDNPAYIPILTGIIDNSSLPQRTQIMAALAKSQQPDPQTVQYQEQMKMLQMRLVAAEVMEIESRAGLANAKAEYEKAWKPKIDMVKAMGSVHQGDTPDQFTALNQIADQALKEKKIVTDNATKRYVADRQVEAAKANRPIKPTGQSK